MLVPVDSCVWGGIESTANNINMDVPLSYVGFLLQLVNGRGAFAPRCVSKVGSITLVPIVETK